MFANRKLLFAGLLLTIAFLVIGWFLIYELSVRTLEKSLGRIEKNLIQKGYQVSYDKVSISGSPFLLKANFQNLHLKDPKRLLEWQGPEMEIQAQPWKINVFTCLFKGDHKITVPKTTPFPLGILDFKETKGIFTISSQGTLQDAKLTAERVSSLLDKQSQPVYLSQVSLNVKDITDPSKLTFSFKTEARNLELVLDLQPFDHPFIIEIEGKFSGYEPKSFPTTLSIWRDGGGVLDITQLKILWEPLILEAQGTVTLDKELYPLGSFSSKIVGYQDALSDMVKLGWVKKKHAKTASFMLELLSVPDETYGRKLTIPITLQNKTLSVGPAPLMQLEPLQDF